MLRFSFFLFRLTGFLSELTLMLIFLLPKCPHLHKLTMSLNNHIKTPTQVILEYSIFTVMYFYKYFNGFWFKFLPF